MRSHLVALLVLAAACKSAAPLPAVARPDAPAAAGRAIDPAADLPTVAEEVTFEAGGRTIPGALVRPTDPGPWPAVILLAGSGPTDRDWNSPLLANQNGSGKLLAEALARHGAVVLRFDKAGVGKNPGPPLDRFTLDTYREEGVAAVALLRARPDVRRDRVFLAGHSEGGIHATRVAAAAGADVAGVVYLSAAARSMADTLLTQLEGNFRDGAHMPPAMIAEHMAPIRAGTADLLAGRPFDPTKISPFPPVQQLFAGLANPTTIGLTRGLLGFDPAPAAAALTVPTLVIAGGKDIQIDPELDARHLERTIKAAGHEVSYHLAPDANHVLEHEPKPMTELRADLLAVEHGYNAAGRTLDDDLVAAVVSWLAAHSR